MGHSSKGSISPREGRQRYQITSTFSGLVLSLALPLFHLYPSLSFPLSSRFMSKVWALFKSAHTHTFFFLWGAFINQFDQRRSCEKISLFPPPMQREKFNSSPGEEKAFDRKGEGTLWGHSFSTNGKIASIRLSGWEWRTRVWALNKNTCSRKG